jgi:hypothetical protein
MGPVGVGRRTYKASSRVVGSFGGSKEGTRVILTEASLWTGMVVVKRRPVSDDGALLALSFLAYTWTDRRHSRPRTRYRHRQPMFSPLIFPMNQQLSKKPCPVPTLTFGK